MKLIKVVNNGVPFNVRVVDNIVEFYDARYSFTPLGQFVSNYYVDTLKDFEGTLILYGGVDDWKISAENMKEIRDWLNNL